MSSDACEGCGRRIQVAGGVANLWRFDQPQTDGVTLELADGSEHRLCFECVDELPEEPTARDVAALPRGDRDGAVGQGAGEAGAGDGVGPGRATSSGGVGYVIVGIVLGALAGAVALLQRGEPGPGDLRLWISTGAALGLAVGLLVARVRERRR